MVNASPVAAMTGLCACGKPAGKQLSQLNVTADEVSSVASVAFSADDSFVNAFDVDLVWDDNGVFEQGMVQILVMSM